VATRVPSASGMRAYSAWVPQLCIAQDSARNARSSGWVAGGAVER
jgi:hypothetical protein